jgi:CHAD domain-containing protein
MSYRLDPRIPLSDGVRRIGIEQLRDAVALLDEGRVKRDGGAHDARKRFKRLRGLLRLVADAAPDFRRREEERVKDIAASLSVIRDATAIVEAIDRLAREADGPQAVDHLMALRRGLLARRDRIVRKQGSLDATINRAIEGLHLAAKAFEDLSLPVAPEEAAALLARGMEKTYRSACNALRKAVRKGRDEDFHELRKSVKYHEMHLQLLGDIWPAELKERWKEAEHLGERLGELHDIPVLAETIESEKIGDKADRKFVRGMMLTKRKELAAECLKKARTLFKASAEEIARDLAIHYVLAVARSEPMSVSAPTRNKGRG